MEPERGEDGVPVWVDPGSPTRRVCPEVAGPDTAVDRARELGASVLIGPTEVGPAGFAVLADDLDASFNVITMKS